MRVLIVSDTHGHDNNFINVIEKEKKLDFMVHLGDIGDLADYIEEISHIACFAVRGNNDYNSFLPDENIIMMGKHRTLITHGHQHGVYYGTKDIKRYARGIGCDTVMYGHTHIPEIDVSNSVTVINPGSLTYPRQPGHNPSYIIAEIDKDGDVTYEIKYL